MTSHKKLTEIAAAGQYQTVICLTHRWPVWAASDGPAGGDPPTSAGRRPSQSSIARSPMEAAVSIAG